LGNIPISGSEFDQLSDHHDISKVKARQLAF
jgi:hypothetical protein